MAEGTSLFFLPPIAAVATVSFSSTDTFASSRISHVALLFANISSIKARDSCQGMAPLLKGEIRRDREREESRGRGQWVEGRYERLRLLTKHSCQRFPCKSPTKRRFRSLLQVGDNHPEDISIWIGELP